MKVFRFSRKEQVKLFTGLTIVSVIFSIILFASLDHMIINQSIALLIVSIFSFISLQMSIKKASKVFEEIIIHEDNIKFYFVNKAKKSLEKKLSEILVKDNSEYIEIFDVSSNQLIGKAYKNKIEKPDMWPRLREELLIR